GACGVSVGGTRCGQPLTWQRCHPSARLFVTLFPLLTGAVVGDSHATSHGVSRTLSVHCPVVLRTILWSASRMTLCRLDDTETSHIPHSSPVSPTVACCVGGQSGCAGRPGDNDIHDGFRGHDDTGSPTGGFGRDLLRAVVRSGRLSTLS